MSDDDITKIPRERSCPFCGKKSLIVRISIACHHCGCSGPWVYLHDRELECEGDYLPVRALEVWNKREREQDESSRDLAAAEELHSRRFSTVKAELQEAHRERDEARFELDEALKECVLAQVGWSEALKQRDEAREELARVRKELAASNRGAETNAKVNKGLCARLAEAERERDAARMEWKEAWEGWNQALDERNEAMKNTEDANRKIERMKKRYAHARKLQRAKASVMVGVIERYYYLLTSTLDALGLSLEILEPAVKRNMPILAMYIDNLKCKEMEIKEAIGAEASK